MRVPNGSGSTLIVPGGDPFRLAARAALGKHGGVT
jgi:hypothetical protein